MNASATQKVMLITGGGRGIGAATATLAASQGYAVVINYQSQQGPAQRVADAINAAGGHAVCVQADVSNEAGVMALFAAVDAQFGRTDAAPPTRDEHDFLCGAGIH